MREIHFIILYLAMQTLIIRDAVAADMEAVHALVRELAEFEKMPEQVRTDAARFAADGFKENPDFYCLVAEDAEAGVVGTAIYYFGYSTWKGKMLYLDDLVIAQNQRRRGIGKQLLDTLVRKAHAANAQQMRWQVLDWNEPAIKLYKKVGAELEGGWYNCYISHEKIRNWATSLD
ncbi:MAG: GNAT family N-acetyltransferase [Bacteroidota bacterium]